MIPLLNCPDCGAILSLKAGEVAVIRRDDGQMLLVAELVPHVCAPVPVATP